MGKVDRLRNRVDPFGALFWALGIVLANTGQAAPHRLTQSMFFYCHSWFNSQRRLLASHPLFLSGYVIYLCPTCSRVWIALATTTPFPAENLVSV